MFAATLAVFGQSPLCTAGPAVGACAAASAATHFLEDGTCVLRTAIRRTT
jgi:hypothetical protein